MSAQSNSEINNVFPEPITPFHVATEQLAAEKMDKFEEQVPGNHPDPPAASQDEGDLNDLQLIILEKQEAVNLTPATDPERPRHLGNLASWLVLKYSMFEDVQDLEAALQARQESVELTPIDHPERVAGLHSLAATFGVRYQRLGSLQDLNTALQRYQEAADLTPADHPDRAGHLRGLATLFVHRYLKLGDLTDLDTALEKKKEIVALTSEDHPSRAGCIRSLAVSFRTRYQRLGALEDLEAALRNYQEAVNRIPADHPDRGQYLQGLAASFTDRYRRFGDSKDLEAALQTDREAVELTPRDHPEWAGRLQGLGESFGDKYRRFGELKDLEAALQTKEVAVELTPAGHPDRARRLASLGVSFSDRYHRLGALKDLQAALQNKQIAVDLTPSDHPELAGRFHRLGVSFGERYQRLGDIQDLEAALQHYQTALDLTPVDHPNRAQQLAGLAVSLGDRYKRLANLSDLEVGLTTYQQAVELTPTGHPDRAERLEGFAILLTARYHKFRDPKDLETALQTQKESINLTPEDHPDLTPRLHDLAASFVELFHISGDRKDLEAVHQNYTAGFKAPFLARPESTWDTGLQWASFADAFDPSYSSAAYLSAFHLLPDLLWIGNEIGVRHNALRRLDIGPATSSATRACMKLSQLASAVEILEQGVATTFQQMLQLKTDIDDLPSEHAEEFRTLSSQLYTGMAGGPISVARKRKELVDKIRNQPGFEYFLLPKPYSALCKASQYGPIVILNSHKKVCDGIIILNPRSDPVHVPLPDVTLDLLKSQKLMLTDLLNRSNVRTREESMSSRLFGQQECFTSKTNEEYFSDLLLWLWTNVVNPVYQVLASYGIHNGRLWWLPTGGFTGLPIHASPPTDHFIHSYTATLGSLLEAQSKKSAVAKFGVVGVTHTSLGWGNYLKGVNQELQKIRAVVTSHDLECLEADQATPEAVKQQIKDCSWVHLACHGTQDLIDPTKSRLMLYGGSLELDTILRMPLSNSEFVFLAACQTAMGDAELVNESFHLGGGLIAAGFQSAVGTLWSMNDQDGPLVAEIFYAHLFRDGRTPQVSDTAEALQIAVNRLRANNVPYERWIPFIHMGV